MLGAELLDLRGSAIDLLLTGLSPREIDTLLKDPQEDDKANEVPRGSRVCGDGSRRLVDAG